MKKINLMTFGILFIVIIMSSGCKNDMQTKEEQPKNIKIICEDTVLPMVSDLIRDYNLNNEPVVTVESLDRENAFNKLSNSEADMLIGYVESNDKQIQSELLAFDGIGIIVNTDNKVNSIGSNQLKKIYTGNIVNWGKLNGQSNTIIPVVYKDGANSIQKVFNSKIMDIPVKEQVSSSIQYVSSIEEMKNFVTQNKNAIGFIPGQWYNENSVFLRLSGIKITPSNLKNKLYPLRFPILMYYPKDKKDNLKELFQYLKSEDSKKVIRKFCIEAF